jgi:hypothetical protein
MVQYCRCSHSISTAAWYTSKSFTVSFALAYLEWCGVWYGVGYGVGYGGVMAEGGRWQEYGSCAVEERLPREWINHSTANLR